MLVACDTLPTINACEGQEDSTAAAKPEVIVLYLALYMSVIPYIIPKTLKDAGPKYAGG